MSTFDPLAWVTSMQRALKSYVEAEIDASVLDGSNQPVGLGAFIVEMDYPQSLDPAVTSDFPKTIIHLSIDDVENLKLGFGSDIVQQSITEGNMTTPAMVVESEGRGHRVNFDVGVWASDLSGGSSSRLVAYEILERIFGGEMARKKCWDTTEGVEILSYDGGRFFMDTINDIRVFRIVDSTLIVRVYSRKDSGESVVTDEIAQDPHLTIPPLAITG